MLEILHRGGFTPTRSPRAERFPRVIAAAEPLSACDDPDAYYGLGLELILAGIEAAAAQRTER